MYRCPYGRLLQVSAPRVSACVSPLLHQVIPLFDIITRKLDEFVDNEKLHPAVHTADAQGRTMLNKYYGLSDESIMYHIAMRKLIVHYF